MGIIAENLNDNTFEDVQVLKDPALESEIVLTAIRAECDSDQEFADLMASTAIEMALYDVISDAEIATEAAKRIVVEDFKTANFNRVVKRTCIRMAALDGNADYTKYKKYRDLMIQHRDKIYKRYETKAKTEARRIIANAKNKSANMTSNTGKDIASKIDAQIGKINTSGKKTST